ncbi:MAG: tyrosine--tRNA ligase [Rhodothermales bacterium]
MSTFLPVEEQLTHIKRGVEEILPEAALVEKLKKSYKTGKPLNVKLGCDPSRPDLHLGHSVVLRKLRQFQDLGHQAILIVGDFTGMIGDPSGRSKTRPPLTLEDTRANGESYFEQATKILHPEKTKIVYNSDWLGQMSFRDVIELAGKYTVARMLERDDFERRYKNGEAIGVHEFLYPLAQAQDSVAIESDVELGGTDQKFNLLVGRSIQEAAGLEPQVCVTLPILEGTDGVEKMSKSLDNYIGISEAPDQMYGKTLSISDELIYRYYELATDIPTAELAALKEYAAKDPRNAKHDLAYKIVEMYYDKGVADKARAHFETTVVKGGVPDEIEEFAPSVTEGFNIPLYRLVTEANLAKSNGEARRLIQQNAVSIDGEKISDPGQEIDLKTRTPFVLKVGKRRFARIVLAS